jgi:drug/metabolite transporter superfamily protein YnfA
VVVNTRGSASAFTSQSVSVFYFFYKPKKPLLVRSRDKHSRGAFQEIPELWTPVPLDVCMKTYYWLNQNRFLSHLRTIFCALAIAGTSLTLPSAEAGGPPLPAYGGFFPCFTRTSARQAGENVIVTFDISGTSTGTFVGSFVGTEMDVVHRDGSITLHGSLLFTGSVNDSPEGTLVVSYEGIGSVVTYHENLQVVFREGTGGLAGINAQGTAEGDVGGACDGDFGGVGTYTGQILFP